MRRDTDWIERQCAAWREQEGTPTRRGSIGRQEPAVARDARPPGAARHAQTIVDVDLRQPHARSERVRPLRPPLALLAARAEHVAELIEVVADRAKLDAGLHRCRATRHVERELTRQSC